MKLEQQVTSLELSRCLHDLGVKQDIYPSAAYWVKIGSGWKLYFLEVGEDSPSQTPFEWHRAFTVAELGEMLPLGLHPNPATSTEVHLETYKHTQGWRILYKDPDYETAKPRFYVDAATEADARAKMLIYLLEKKLI